MKNRNKIGRFRPVSNVEVYKNRSYAGVDAGDASNMGLGVYKF